MVFMQNREPQMHPYVYVGIHYKEIVKEPKKVTPKLKKLRFTRAQILEIVANECEVTKEEIMSRSRRHTIVDARHLYFVALRLKFKLNLSAIGKLVNNRDHTTVIHGLKAFQDRYRLEEGYSERADRVFQQIYVNYDGRMLTNSI